MATRQCCQIGKGNNLICTFHTFESDLQNLWALSAESSHHCGFWDYSTVYIALYSFHEARYCCCCSITQSCLTICNTMDCSVLGFPILLHLPGFAQTHVPWVSDAIQHLILCCPLLLLPSIFPRIRVFSNKSALCIRWPQYWNFSFSIRSSNEYLGLISLGLPGLIL